MASRGKTELPDPFPINEKMRNWADENVPTLNVDHYHEQFCDHWYGDGGRKKNWFAAWRVWMRRTDDGSAPGLYGRDDKRIVRKRPRSLKQSEMFGPPPAQLSETEQYSSEVDKLRAQAFDLGMPLVETRFADMPKLRAFIREKQGTGT